MNRILAAALAAPLLATAALNAAPALASPPPGAACTDPAVLGFITRDFEFKATRHLKVNLSIYEIRRMQLGRYEPRNTYLSSVARDYCHARVAMTDGGEREMWYLVERPWGFAGTGRSVEYCISGLDPWHVYGAHCKSLR